MIGVSSEETSPSTLSVHVLLHGLLSLFNENRKISGNYAKDEGTGQQ